MTAIQWPDGKSFAFTVFDDTDLATPGNYEAIYRLLRDNGLLTTKSVWPLSGERPSPLGGATCDDAKYVSHMLELQRDGFEIGLHGTTFHSVTRPLIERGLDRFRELFGHDPRTMANHSDCIEGIYWGDARVTGIRRLAYNTLTGGRQRQAYQGHIESSTYFWGDLCRARIDYVRNFITGDINTLRAFPWVPYHDPSRPYVKQWFAGSEGPDVHSFIDTISEANQDRLQAERGACIMYTHFARGFQNASGSIHPRFKQLIIRLSKKNGWFVPVATLLDYIRSKRGEHVLTRFERARMERSWLIHKIRLGRRS